MKKHFLFLIITRQFNSCISCIITSSKKTITIKTITMKKLFHYSLLILLLPFWTIGQNASNDSIKLDYNKILSYCVQTNVKPVLSLLDVDTTKLSEKDKYFKLRFENRFKYNEDRGSLNGQQKTSVDSLINIYKSYWRASLLNPEQEYDSLLVENLNSLFKYQSKTKADTLGLDSRIRNYVTSKGYYTLGNGKVGRLQDLLIWKTEKDTIYTFSIYTEKISAKVIFLEDFVSLGWSRYVTFDKSIGGWAKDDGLYCVKESYDIESDGFKIHYLAHEGRHFEDYKIFPNLSGYDLEYRAKLTEISLAQETLYPLIKQFITSANYDSDNQHPVANYVVIKNLSKKIFNSEFEKDISKWEAIDVEVLNKAAYELLNENTAELHNEGDEVEFYIKNPK